MLGRAEPPARGEGRADLGAGGEPARVADGAVRLQGHRGAAGAGSPRWSSRRGRLADLAAEGVLPADAHHYRHLPYTCGEGRGPPVRAVPRASTPSSDPEMKSTGEVMGIDRTSAWRSPRPWSRPARALPTSGTVFVSRGQPRQTGDRVPGEAAGGARVPVAGDQAAPPGVLAARRASRSTRVAKVVGGTPQRRGPHPWRDGGPVINTPFGRGPRSDGYFIRTAAAAAGCPASPRCRGVRGRAGDRGAARAASEPLTPPGAPSAGRVHRRRGSVRGGDGVVTGESDEARPRRDPVHAKRSGAYHSITLVAPEIAERRAARPVPGDRGCRAGRDFLLRRHFPSIRRPEEGGWAGTLEFAFDPGGPGTEWLAEVAAHDFLDVIGPLGQGRSPYPKRPRTASWWRRATARRRSTSWRRS